ncbi:MAG TPA: hypothetical protein VNS46_11850 [Nocardioides sp.]|nr:hypothetical protein [Nocardioides sp.]
MRSAARADWVRACTLAEAIGITAAAAAARTATWLTDDRDVAPGWALAVVVAGGLVEGTALGLLQARSLRDLLGRRAARRWAAATVAVAGLAWAAGSAPATLSSGGGSDAPPLALVLLGGAALGAVTGGLLGGAQALAARRERTVSLRWVLASAVGWTAAMPVIYLGAGLPDADWPVLAVVPLGTVTGLAAGAVLGALTGRAALRLAKGPERGGSKVPTDGEVRPWEREPAAS